MAAEGPTTGVRGRAAWVGGSVAVAGLLPLLPGTLGVLDLSGPITVCVSALTVIAGLMVGQRSLRRARIAETRERERELGKVLLRWPTPTFDDVDPVDIGVRVGLGADATYVERDNDASMVAALRDHAALVVFGPPGAGKSRSAFEAVRTWSRGAPSPLVLAPRDAQGLDRLLDEHPDDVLPPEAPAILWLDGLDRFLPDLSIDRLQAFLAGPERPSLVARVRSGWARSGEDPEPPPARNASADTAAPPAVRVRLVATIRDDALAALLTDTAPEALVLRQILLRGVGVPLPAALDADERGRPRVGSRSADPPRDVASVFASDWATGWQRAVPPARPPHGATGWRDWDRVMIGYGVMAILVLGAGWWLHGYYGWTPAPPVADQVAHLKADRPACERVSEYPRHGAGLPRTDDPNEDTLVAIVSGDECERSDEAEIYRLATNGRLDEIASLTPPGLPRNVLTCIGPDRVDPCHVALAGHTPYLTATFWRADTARELPVIGSFVGDHIQIDALSPPEHRVPPGYRGDVQVPLQTGSDERTTGSGCSGRTACVNGRAATVAAIAAKTDDHPAMLLVGYERADDRVHVRMWKIGFGSDGHPKLSRDCLAFFDGRPQGLAFRKTSRLHARELMQPSSRRPGTRIVC